ncbi:MAG TPA: TerC family protein [Devosia sp.]|nr:TerC family protein [Devosia sp.]
MHLFADPGAFGALFQVIMIDLVLAGDNAVVIGLAAAGLPPRMRNKAIIVGIGSATALRIAFAFAAMQILAITGLLLAGGILLLWVCWKMWQETRAHAAALRAQHAMATGNQSIEIAGHKLPPPKTLGQAVMQIVIADISMSLDNVLAVAGAAQKHPAALVFGLALSVALMGFASAFIAHLLDRHRWIAYLGLAIIFVVALRMIYAGLDDVVGGAMPDIPHVSG